MARFDALFFDMDGTLVENTKLMPAAFQKAFAFFGYDISIDPWRGSGCTDYEVMDIYLSDYPLTDEEKAALKEKVGKKVQELVINEVQSGELKALPGTIELIRKLNAAGIKPGLLTGNMEAIVGPKLKSAGMSRDEFYYGGFGDHSPRRAVTAARALDSAEKFLGQAVDPARTLVIGDTPNDIACARAVGASVLAVATGRYCEADLQEYKPDFLLPDLTDHDAFFKIIGITPIS